MCNELYKVLIAPLVKYLKKINHHLITVTLDIWQFYVLESVSKHDCPLLFVQTWDLNCTFFMTPAMPQ